MPDNILLQAPTSTGEILATDQIGTSSGPHYQYVKLVDGTAGSSGELPGDVTNGLDVDVTRVGGTVTIVSASSGLVQISGGVTATAGTNPWSSAPSFNVPVINASSGLVQVIPVTSSGVNLYTTAGINVVSASSGLVQISGTPTVTATAATNPWSSAPGFNVPLVSASSGLVQISGTVTIVSASSGLVQISGTPTVTATAATNPWSSAPGFNVPIISASSGLIQISGSITATAGTNPWSSAPGFNVPIISASSGLVQISGTPTVTATAATNPWSSAPGFNVPVVSVSSGLIRTLNLATITTSGLLAYHKMSTGGAVAVNVTTAPTGFLSYAIFNSSVTYQAVKFYNSTNPTVGGSTANLLLTVGIPGSTGGGGANLALPSPGVYSSNGWSIVITANLNDTDTGAPSTNNISVGMIYQS